MKNDPRFRHFLPYSLFLLCGILLLFRCFLGFDSTDEVFYIETANRFLQGDLPFVQEWHPAQLCGLFILPLVAVYRGLAGSLEGIIVFLRICYVAFSACIAVYVYHALIRNHNSAPAFCAALILLLYVKTSIPTFSYNTLSSAFFVLSFLHLYQYFLRQAKKSAFLSGVFYALGTLLIPYAALTCVLIFVAALIYSWIQKAERKRVLTCLLFSFLGIFCVAFFFLTALFLAVSPRQIYENAQYIFANPEHSDQKGFISRATGYARSLFRAFRYPLFISLVCLIVSLIRRNMSDKSRLAIALIGTAIFVLNLAVGHFYAESALAALSIYGAQLYILTKKRRTSMFFPLFLGGIFLSIAYYLTSNTGFPAIGCGLLLSAISSVFFIFDFAEELPAFCRWMSTAGKSVIAVVIAYILSTRMLLVYRDAPLNQLNCPLRQGPAKGLYTTSQQAEIYNTVYEDVRDHIEGSLMIVRLAPWVYLIDGVHCAAPSSWRMTLKDWQIPTYFNRTTIELPDYIITLDPVYDPYGDTAQWRKSAELPDHPEFMSLYEESSILCGTLYTKK